MTTRWKQKASVALLVIMVLVLFLITILLWSAVSNGMLSTHNNRNRINISENSVSFIEINPSSSSSSSSSTSSSYVGNRYKDIINNNNTKSTTKKPLDSEDEDYSRVEYVRPLKIHHLPLHTDDLLYESKKNSSIKAELIQGHRITGNYKNNSSRIWDPHPEYTIDAFGHHLHLILYQDHTFIPDTLRVKNVWLNRTEPYEEEHRDNTHLQGCFYKGRIKEDDNSAVAVSLCNGMRGHIRTTFGSFFIEPVEDYTSEDTNILHKISSELNKIVLDIPAEYRRNSSCPIEDHLKDDNSIDAERSTNGSHRRKKRSIVNEHQYTLEVLIAVDRKMQEFHGEHIKSYILTLMSIVSSIYSDASIGNSINVAVVNILLLQGDLSITYIDKGVYASHLLRRFCLFMTNRTEHYDTALLLTREQICRNTTETKCDTLGLAELGTVCKKQSCSIVQDNGLPAAFTIAHELGHILNMPHDDDTKCEKFRKHGKRMLHIMSSTMGEEIHPWSWSDCSRHFVTEFLEKNEMNCMRDIPENPMRIPNKKLPGERYSLDKQCELIHGTTAKYCNYQDERECVRLWCFDESDAFDCRSSNLPWADGTPCQDPYHWCQKGACVHKDRSRITPIDGGWGDWTPYTPCSRSCGGGVQESQRDCNSPAPSNGGKYCIGKRKKYRSCNTNECPPEALEFREQQCFELNGNNFGIQGIDRNIKWVPKYGVSAKDECKLYCRVDKSPNYFRLADKVIDGTTCSYDSFDKCINGVCRPAGCDNVLDSAAKLDRCGVCEGNNDTCKEIRGHFYKNSIEGMEYANSAFYFHVIKIPRGSANIVITQPGYPESNYIVLLNDHGEYLLNGDKLLNSFKKVFAYGGVTFDYSGTTSDLEMVNTTYSRRLKRDLIVQILSLPYDNQTDDKILLTYSYTADNSHRTQYEVYPPPQHHHHHSRQNKIEIYQWQHDEWSNCNALCNGESHRSLVCVNVDKGLKVSSSHCDASTRRNAQEYITCNSHCDLVYSVKIRSECSSSCGEPGTRSISYTCIQKFLANNTSSEVDSSYCVHKFRLPTMEDCTGSCGVWNYTEWSACTATCGHAQQTRSVVCLSYPNGPITDDSHCSQTQRQSLRETIRNCNQDPCPQWVREGPTPCSVTCGIGVRTTAIYCKQNNQIVDKHMCSGYPMPSPIKINCSMPPCPSHQETHPNVVTAYDHYNYRSRKPEYPNYVSKRTDSNSRQWRVEGWSKCQSNCYRNRTVICMDPDPNNCPMETRPESNEYCCREQYKYKLKWSDCSVECGVGTKTRIHVCAKIFESTIKGERPVKRIDMEDDRYCKGHIKRKPKVQRKTCRRRKDNCLWEAGTWSPCSKNCDYEFSSRSVNCVHRNGTVLTNENCAHSKKPTIMRKCSCVRPVLRRTNCTCEGVRKRRYICYDKQDKVAPCPPMYHSVRKEACEPPPECLPTSCFDVIKKKHTYADGEYTLSIKRKPINIYCHNMKSHKPEEFITLREEENFSVYYDKRAKDASECPTEHTRHHNEFIDNDIPYGSTQFQKIRIDIETMRVIEDDYTFATSRNKAQKFGSAGDCYNTNEKCPQGYFSIDLKDTGLSIRPNTNWELDGHSVTMDFIKKLEYPYQSVIGLCGGYCGNCFVSRNTTLILDPL